MAKETDKNIEPIDASFEDIVGSIVPNVAPPVALTQVSSSDLEIVQYELPLDEDRIDFRFDGGSQSIWATQQQIADLFETNKTNITQQLGNIFNSGELNEATNVRISDIGTTTKPTKLYSLDAVISVGYRRKLKGGD